MNKSVVVSTILFFFLGFTVPDIEAQLSVPMPKIPGIKRDKKPAESERKAEPSRSTSNSEAVPASQNSNNDDVWDGVDFRVKSLRDELRTAQQEIAEFTPETKTTIATNTDLEWLWRAISPSERTAFFDKWNSLMSKPVRNWFEQEIKKLSEIAANRIPLFQAGKNYAFRSPVEEKMMRAALATDVPGVIVHKIGLNHSEWQYGKNNLGIPIDRYKWGMIWGRNPKADDPYCRFFYVNIIQDYAGGGTYGRSYAKWVKSEIAGCPAAK